MNRGKELFKMSQMTYDKMCTNSVGENTPGKNKVQQ